MGLVLLSGLVLLAIERLGGGAAEISDDLCRDSYDVDPANGGEGGGAAVGGGPAASEPPAK